MKARPIKEIAFDDPQLTFGFLSDIDSDGVRRFIYLSERMHLVYGLDVPCSDLKKYLAPNNLESDQLLTSTKIYCRIGMVKFSGRSLKSTNRL